MTPARKAALQWLHDQGEVARLDHAFCTPAMLRQMDRDEQVQFRTKRPWGVIWSLTDKGRRDLHEAGK